MTHQASPNARTVARRRARLAVAALSVGLMTLVLLPGAAVADTPAGWEKAPDVSGLEFLVVLVLIPAALSLVISLLAALPSMIGDKGYEPGQSWRSEAEWFGGAGKGVEAADQVGPAEIKAAESDKGGASGSW